MSLLPILLELTTLIASVQAGRTQILPREARSPCGPNNQPSVALHPYPKAPWNASALVDSSFPSFAIQGSSLPAFTGNKSHPNTFSQNLIREIQDRTGGPLVVRVGGTNTDYSKFNPDQIEPITPPQQGAGIGQKFVFGPSFYEGIPNWKGTRWIYDVPFALQNHTDSYGEAKAAIDSIGLENLEALELGNEPDLYIKQGSRSPGWGPQEYVANFNDYSTWLSSALDLPDWPIYEALTLSAAHDGMNWSAQSVFEAGITDTGRVKSISLHHYENTNTTTDLQSTLMNHSYVKAGVDTYQHNLQYTLQNWPHIQINFGESGRYTTIANAQTKSTDDSEGIFGAALWTADYLLYLMSLGVTRVNMQLGKVFGYVAWHPVFYDDIVPQVRSPYYGHLFVSDFMGGSKVFRVIEVPTDDDLLAVYAGYENNHLKRVAIINFDIWQGEGCRTYRTFTIQAPPGARTGRVQTLTSSKGATANDTFYWAGHSWSYESNGKARKVHGLQEYQNSPVFNGKLKVNVGASEAVMVHF
ncbi:hypothetical protein BGZ63DRAFT_429703 [Mariannaea sp. PMI_226]|nr:hypothetical protein BGZ63DRAFT_429703 [Mariannaea sp. PMI_226]